MKDKIYLDFDRTLFDTDTFIIDLFKVLNKKIDLSLFQKYYEEEKNKGFNPYHILKIIETKEKINTKDLIKDLDVFMNNLDKYIYPDTIPFLKKIKKKYEINLFTYGDSSFQKMKVTHTKINDYIDNYMDTLSSKGENKKIDYASSIFIDDNPMVVDSIIGAKKVIRIRRKHAKYSDLNTKRKVIEVDSLEKVTI